MAKGDKSTKATKATKPAKATREKLPGANGVTRPKDGTDTGKVWKIADSISSKTRQPAKRAAVLEQAGKENINPATAATQYGKWRKFNGLKREDTAPKAAAAKKATKATKATKAKAPKKASSIKGSKAAAEPEPEGGEEE